MPNKNYIDKVVAADAVKKEKEDYRDYDARRVMGVATEPIPEKYSVFHQPFIEKIKKENQKKTLACMSFATSSYAEIKEQKENKKFVDLSPRGIYPYVALQDGGSYIRANCKSWQKRGIPTEKTCPSIPTTEDYLRKKPSQEALEEAFIYSIEGYARDFRGDDPHFMARMIYENDGFLTGAMISRAGWDITADYPLVRPPKPGEKQGGHGFYVGAYDLSVPIFWFLNSWGNWGFEGFGAFTTDYILSDKLFNIWTAVDKPNPNLTMDILDKKITEEALEQLYLSIHHRMPDEAAKSWIGVPLGEFLLKVRESKEFKHYEKVYDVVKEIEKWGYQRGANIGTWTDSSWNFPSNVN